ncbi:hypothetical protein KWG64_09050 [Rahnella sp. PD12R]|uniref:hypothetical protein n=1 Tax=Rahnella sp. PD12R TaxID=2855688 RepID=UPI001C45C179|nr:hypothetical protein [Rahnella sp. PD12R]MBV6818093.1 hypothetical protein [Rahnella sp. PD12R]
MLNLIKLDKRFTPYLFKAIHAAKGSDFVLSGMCDIENYNVLFEDIVHKRNGKEFYTISFYAKEVTKDNWMDASPRTFDGVNVDIDAQTQEVIYVYIDR